MCVNLSRFQGPHFITTEQIAQQLSFLEPCINLLSARLNYFLLLLRIKYLILSSGPAFPLLGYLFQEAGP